MRDYIFGHCVTPRLIKIVKFPTFKLLQFNLIVDNRWKFYTSVSLISIQIRTNIVLYVLNIINNFGSRRLPAVAVVDSEGLFNDIKICKFHYSHCTDV